jgi:hypothetical protein
MGDIVKYIPSRDQIVVKNIFFFDKSSLELHNPLEELKTIYRHLMRDHILHHTEEEQFILELSEYVEGELKYQIEEYLLTKL